MEPLSASLPDETSVYEIASSLKRYAAEIGFDEFQCGMVGLAFMEIAMNAVRHAGGGRSVIGQTDNGKGIEVQVEDCGPGIAELAQAFQDGYSSYGSYGLGLGAAKRSVDELTINKCDSTGTSITIRHYLPVSPDDIDVSVVSRSASREEPNGDSFVTKTYHGESLLAAIIDGSGKGRKAAVTSKYLAELVGAEYLMPLDKILQICDHKLRDAALHRKAEMCLLRVTPAWIEFASVGDCRGYCDQPEIGLAQQDGTIGLCMPDEIRLQRFKRPKTFAITLCSDGFTTQIERPEFNNHSAYQNAKYLFDRYCTGQDDATIIYIRGQL